MLDTSSHSKDRRVTASETLQRIAREYGIYLAFIILVIALSFANKYFLTQSNISNILLQTSINGVLAFGMTFVIITGGIDLSVGSVLALAGIVSASFATNSRKRRAWRPLSGLCRAVRRRADRRCERRHPRADRGAIQGSRIRRDPRHASAARGLTLIYAGGRPVPALTPQYRWIGNGNLFGIPAPVVIFAAAFLISWFVLARTRFGRYVYAVGGNARAAKTSGINVVGVRVLVYVISGGLAGLPACCSRRARARR